MRHGVSTLRKSFTIDKTNRIMPYILNIESATTLCSVSLSKDGKLMAYKELNDGFTHAENLHLFIDDVLKEAQVQVKKLNAIAVSKGPGSYTGLRIGTSAAKGLAYALGIPLISVGTLEILSNHYLITKNAYTYFCPMIDARRMEVYTALYDQDLATIIPVQALIVDEQSIQTFREFSEIYFFGNGMQKCQNALSTLANARFIDGVVPSAKYMCSMSFNKFNNKDFENLAYFEPFYLKDFLITAKKK